MKRALHKLLLPRIVSRSCESRIPRSGKKGEAVNCYVVAIDSDGERDFIATSVAGGTIKGLKWDGDSYADAGLGSGLTFDGIATLFYCVINTNA